MYLIENADGTVRYPVNLRLEFPNTSFPGEPAVSDLPDGVCRVMTGTIPSLPPGTIAVESAPEKRGGWWYQTWEIQPIPAAQIAATMEAAWRRLRVERDRRLSECDWMFLKDVPIDSALLSKWSEYRRRLRDITAVTNDPTAPVWPEKPE